MCEQGLCCTGADVGNGDLRAAAALDVHLSSSDTCGSQTCAVVVTNSHFNRNSGGALAMNAYGSNGNFNATSSTFTNNSGGAVQLVARDILISNLSFIGNSAQDSGGALASSDFTKLQILDCAFRNNHVWTPREGGNEEVIDGLFGGAIFLSSICPRSTQDCGLLLLDTEFYGNLGGHKDWPAYESTGAVHMDLEGFEVFISRCLFAGNEALSKVSVGGTEEAGDGATLVGRKVSTGALHITKSSQYVGSVVYLNNNSFIDNTALVSGAVHLYGASCIAVINNTFEGNSGGDAGALNIFSTDGHPIKCYKGQPEAFQDVLAIPLFSPTRPVNRSVGYTYALPGGAGLGDYYYTDKSCNVDIRGSTFSNNKAVLHGALFIDTAQHPCGITSIEFY